MNIPSNFLKGTFEPSKRNVPRKKERPRNVPIFYPTKIENIVPSIKTQNNNHRQQTTNNNEQQTNNQ